MNYAKRSATHRLVRRSFYLSPERARQLEGCAKELGASQAEVARRRPEASLDRVDLSGAKASARR